MTGSPVVELELMGKKNNYQRVLLVRNTNINGRRQTGETRTGQQQNETKRKTKKMNRHIRYAVR